MLAISRVINNLNVHTLNLLLKMCDFDARAIFRQSYPVENGGQSLMGNYFNRHFKLLQFSPTSTELKSRFP